MASWVTHLRIAKILGEKNDLGDLDLSLFYLGNIAPDSGEQVEGGYIPAKTISHFGHSVNREYDRFFSEYLSRCTDKVEYSFMLGYFAHLLADGIWVLTELDLLKKEFAGDFLSDEDFYNELKKDLYTADREYINTHRDFVPAAMLMSQIGFENMYFPFFSRDAFDKQIKRIGKSIDSMTAGEYVYNYILPQRVEKYIDNTVELIIKSFEEYGLTNRGLNQ
jgi:hypothetical protein